MTIQRERQLHLFPPKPGQEIYFSVSDHNTRGLGTIGRVEDGVSAGKEVPFVSCREVPGTLFNWENLEQQQKSLRQVCGNAQVQPC